MAGGCHNLSVVGEVIRSYLNCEWQRKIRESTPSVPVTWAASHPGALHDFNPLTLPGKVATVPYQQNGWDCGLFVLTYMDFWTHTPPGRVEMSSAGVIQGTYYPLH